MLVAWLFRVWQLPSLPPGLHHDEAIEGLNALEVLAGNFRFWFPAGGGREPLFMYVAAGAIGVLGPTALALRLLAAFCATLLVAGSFTLGRRLFDRPTALVAAGLMATSYWQVHTGRLGLRSAMLPPLAALGVALLLRAAERRRASDSLLGGLLMGATAYTYFAARLLPLVALPVALAQLRRAPRQALFWVGVYAVTAAPMAAYVILAPERANERVGEASVFAQADPAEALRGSVLGALGMFFVRGDEMWKYNFDARPIFAPPIALLFLLGLSLCLARLRERGPATTLLWLVTMTLPTALATESPHFIRSGGLGPVLFLLPALAAVWLWRRLPAALARGGLAVVALAVAATGLATYRDYFGSWAGSSETGPAFAYDMAAAAAQLRGLNTTDPVYLSVDPYEPRQLVVQFLAAPVLPAGRLHWFDGRRGLVLPPEPATVLFPISARPPAGLLESMAAERLADGPLVAAYRIAPPPFARSLGRVGAVLDLLRADPPRPGRADEPLTPLLAFRLLDRLTDDLTLFGQIEGQDGGWGSRDDRFYLTANRLAGETVVAPFAVAFEPGAPAGDYRLRVGVYRRDGQRLRLPDGRDSLLFDPVHVEAAGRPWRGPPPPGADVAGPIAPGLRLSGATISPAEARVGERVTARLFWTRAAEDAPSGCLPTLTLRVGGKSLASAQARLGGNRPPAEWAVGELVQQRLAVVVPPAAAGGTFGDLLLDACGVRGLPIGEVRLADVARTTEPPAPPSRLVATFGQSARLIGYGLEGDWRPGAALRLTLYWQALGPSERPLTVFTHLLDALERVRGQRDAQPLDGARPTTGWVAGEYLIDPYRLTIAPDARPGEYLVEIGLYDPSSGAREPVVDADGKPIGDRLILERGRIR